MPSSDPRLLGGIGRFDVLEPRTRGNSPDRASREPRMQDQQRDRGEPGYEDEHDEARRRAQEEARERINRRVSGDWVVGRLLRHGSARHNFDPEREESYFVRLQTSHGREVLWGSDLKRAVEYSRSQAKVGDIVGVRIVEHKKLENDKSWNRWQVDRATYIVKVKRVAREILDNTLGALRVAKDGGAKSVTGADLVVAGAEILARVKFAGQSAREQYVASVRAAAGLKPRPLAESISEVSVTDGEREKRKDGAPQAPRRFIDRLHEGEWVGGTLIAHGKAPYRFEPTNSESYYVRLQTAKGRETVWGEHLKNAMKAASRQHVKVGDNVSLRIVSRDELDSGRIYNRYEVVHRMQLVKDRRAADQMLSDPVSSRRAGQEGAAMTGSYLLIAGARTLARVGFTDDHSRKAFISRVREAALGKARSLEESQPAEREEPRALHVASPVQSQGFARE
jgi:hypothetical protein